MSEATYSEVVFTTVEGAEIILRDASNSTFEITRAAIALIDHVDALKVEGQEASLDDCLVATPIGHAGHSLVLVSHPERYFAQPLAAVEMVAGESLHPIAGFDLEELAGEIAEQVVEIILDKELEDLEEEECDDCRAEREAAETTELTAAVETSFNEVDGFFDEFYDEFANLTPAGMAWALDELGAKVRDYADHLPECNPAGSSLYALGAGIKIAVDAIAVAYPLIFTHRGADVVKVA
jgi:hypothetical protein